jgi:lysyl-tRNA synthetase class 2
LFAVLLVCCVVCLLASILTSRRDASAKLIFFAIVEDGAKLQVLCNFAHYADQAQWTILLSALRPGDVIGVHGYPARSNTGELSIVPREVLLLAPCLHMIPHKLLEVETR